MISSQKIMMFNYLIINKENWLVYINYLEIDIVVKLINEKRRCTHFSFLANFMYATLKVEIRSYTHYKKETNHSRKSFLFETKKKERKKEKKNQSTFGLTRQNHAWVMVDKGCPYPSQGPCPSLTHLKSRLIWVHPPI